MEHLRRNTCPESLKATLNCYQLSSIDSLSGPSGYPAQIAQMWFKENKQLTPTPPQPIVPLPFLIPNDKSTIKSETKLCGETITCFIVGGEKRLCLPQILTSVLREFSIADINHACAELHIFCSRCSPDQLEMLKVLGILPVNTTQCGLITKTDAERLVSALFEEPPPSYADNLTKNLEGIPVCHECFGECDGVIFSEFYSSPNSACIECRECKAMLTPQKFILHTHRGLEKRTCHWGFDPENWRSYLILPIEIAQGKKRNDLDKNLDSLKERFNPARVNYLSSPPVQQGKRRFDSEPESPRNKKMKDEDVLLDSSSMIPRALAAGMAYGIPAAIRPSAFRPWSESFPMMSQMDLPLLQTLPHLKAPHGIPFAFDRPIFPQYLQSGAPVLIRTSSESERQTTTSKSSLAPTPGSVPNVCLAPSSTQRATKDSKDNDDAPKQRIPPKPISTPKLSSPPPLVPCSTNKNDATAMKSPTDLQRPVSRSREAADAMLQLKSAGAFNKNKTGPSKSTWGSQPSLSTAPQVSIAPPAGQIHKTPSDPSGKHSTVVPLDASRQHYKWSIGANTYIISSAGVQELDYLYSLVNSSESDRKTLLMHELVKMKSRFEEKLDIKARVKRDLEMELEHLKSMKKQQIADLLEEKRKITEDFEHMRQKYCSRIDELSKEKQILREKLNDHSKSNDEPNVEDYEKKVEELYSRVHSLESSNDKLRVMLHEEKDKTRSCEMKLQESDQSRGRMSFLKESPLSRMVRTNKRSSEDLNNNSSTPPRKSGANSNYLSMITNKKQRITSVEDEEIIVE